MPINLSGVDYQDLVKQGFSPEEINSAVKEIEKEELTGVTSSKGTDPREKAYHSPFGVKPDENLVKFQLELGDILEKAEHFLRGDVLKFENGHIIWIDNPHPETNFLNALGVQTIMRDLVMYVNRNTILGDYEKQEINLKVLDFGKALNNFVFMKYEELGMVNSAKRKEYQMLILSITDMVHSSYSRSKDGGERQSLREARQVSQTDQLTHGGVTVNAGQSLKTRSLLNPLRYIAGKNY